MTGSTWLLLLLLFSNGASVMSTSEVCAPATLLLLIVDCYSCTSVWVAYIDLTFMSDFIRIQPSVLDLKHAHAHTHTHTHTTILICSVPMGIVGERKITQKDVKSAGNNQHLFNCYTLNLLNQKSRFWERFIRDCNRAFHRLLYTSLKL